MTVKAVSYGRLLCHGLWFSPSRLSVKPRNEPEMRMARYASGGVGSKSERLVWTGLRRRGWDGVEVGVSMQLMRSGRGLGSFKATCELRKFGSRW